MSRCTGITAGTNHIILRHNTTQGGTRERCNVLRICLLLYNEGKDDNVFFSLSLSLSLSYLALTLSLTLFPLGASTVTRAWLTGRIAAVTFLASVTARTLQQGKVNSDSWMAKEVMLEVKESLTSLTAVLNFLLLLCLLFFFYIVVCLLCCNDFFFCCIYF